MRSRGTERAFTLIELLVVITILGLLATFVVVRYPDWVDEGRVTKARAEISSFEEALEMYRLEKNRYPSTAEGLEALTEGTTKHPEGYLRKFSSNDPWGNPYEYTLVETRKYVIVSLGADGAEGGEGYDADIRSDETESDSE